MSHFDEQNEPFCDAKRPVLKKQMIFFVGMFGFFTVPEPFSLLKRSKILAGFFGNFS